MQDNVISYDVTRWLMAMFTASIFKVLNFSFVFTLKQMNRNQLQLNYVCIYKRRDYADIHTLFCMCISIFK